MYSTILFDLGGVLFTNGTNKFIDSISSRYAISKDIVLNVIDGELGTKYREAQITRDEFWQKLIEILNIDEDSKKLEAEWIGYYDLIPKTKEIIQRLNNNYSIYYLSDNVKERVDGLNSRFDFLKLFKGGVFSHDAGVRKPNPRVYEYTLKKLNLKPNETVFIDDKESSLLPADKLGIKTILFSSPDQLETDLVKIGLKF